MFKKHVNHVILDAFALAAWVADSACVAGLRGVQWSNSLRTHLLSSPVENFAAMWALGCRGLDRFRTIRAPVLKHLSDQQLGCCGCGLMLMFLAAMPSCCCLPCMVSPPNVAQPTQPVPKIPSIAKNKDDLKVDKATAELKAADQLYRRRQPRSGGRRVQEQLRLSGI